MVGAVGLLSVTVGAVVESPRIARRSIRFPAHVVALETGAGILLIGGFALTSSALPVISKQLIVVMPAMDGWDMPWPSMSVLASTRQFGK